MIRSLFAGAALAAGIVATASPAMASWSRSYVIEWYEPALYFGSTSDSTNVPGADCPQGTNPPPDWVSLLQQGGMAKDRAEFYGSAEARSQGASLYNVIPTRAPGGANVYAHPDAIPDPGVLTVQGDVAYGFDLDNNPGTGFLSVDRTQRGIDNAFYRASGCILRFRGPPRKSVSSMYSNDGMHDGVYTVVYVLSGDGADPRNDPSAKLGVYLAKDRVVKDANGQVSPDYTYRIDPDPRFQTVLNVAVRGGVVETTTPQQLKMRDMWTPGFFPKELVLEQARVRLEMRADGTLNGMIGGYRDWREHYRGTSGNGSDGSGAIHEVLGQFQLPGWWYAMKRYADGMPDPVTGEMRGISTTYSVNLVPAFVATPDARSQVTVARLFDPEPQTRAEARPTARERQP